MYHLETTVTSANEERAKEVAGKYIHVTDCTASLKGLRKYINNFKEFFSLPDSRDSLGRDLMRITGEIMVGDLAIARYDQDVDIVSRPPYDYIVARRATDMRSGNYIVTEE